MENSRENEPNIQLNTPVLVFLVVILAILVILDGYQGWWILLVAFGGLWMFASIWAFALYRGLQIRREIRLGWAQVGDRLEERFTLTNRALVPALWVEVIGQTNMPDYWANQVRSVKRQAETRWQIRGVCTQRGIYTLGPTTVKTYDPFGIYTVALQNPAFTTLVVTPPVVPLPHIQIAPGGRAGEGDLRVKALDHDIDSAGVREYLPGDSMRKIHWPTSARKNAFYVREFERSPAGDWWIILDLEKEVQFGEGKDATEEHAVILGASLTDLGMRTGRSIGLATHGNSLVWHRPQLSDEHKWEILRSLAVIQPGQVSLSALLEMFRLSADRKASLIIVTPAVDGKWLPSLMALMRLGIVPTLLLFDPQTFGSEESPSYLAYQLTELGITSQLISKEILQESDLQTRAPKDWGWRDSSSGDLVPARAREEFSWRDLG